MKIRAFSVDGPLPTEIPYLQEIERKFPSEWLGFANVIIRHPTNLRFEREIDLIMVTHDRILMVDLKHWKGRLELVEGYWHQDGERRESSPVEKMRGNVHLLLKVFEGETFKLRTPKVEGLVVLTHPNVDTSLLGADAQAVMRIGEFLRLADPRHYRSAFPGKTHYSDDPLGSGKNRTEIQRFFAPGRIFEPRKTRFSSYEAVDPQPEFSTGLYAEYFARDVEFPTNTALLKVWDLSGDDELRLGPERKLLLDRERAVIGYLTDRDPDLAAIPLRPRARDPELGPRHWELFDRDRHLQRLSRFSVATAPSLDLENRIELAKVLSGHVAGLHRADVAHRDLGSHSIWLDQARLRVSLSSFGAARFPERRSLGSLRPRLLGAELTLPEDSGVVDHGSGYQQDVFLLAHAVWQVISDTPLPTDSGVPDWTKVPEQARTTLSPELAAWFARGLEWDPGARFANAIEAHDALLQALDASGGRPAGTIDLTCYEADVDPTVDYPILQMIDRTRCRIYTTKVGDETLLVKNWPDRQIGDRSKNAARLIEFFARAERLRGAAAGRLPRVRSACLSQDGLFLLQDYLAGEPLENFDVSTWTADEFVKFSRELVDIVSEAHDLGIAHGDLSPRNVLIGDSDGPAPRIIDFLDFSTEAAGDRVTLAYVPPESGDDPYARDRYAAATIVTEISSKVTALEGAYLADLKRAVDECSDLDAPWATLKPLADALTFDGRRRTSDSISLVIGFPRCQTPGAMLADDGQFHVVLLPERDEISIVGFDCQLILSIDHSSRAILNVKQAEARTQTLAWTGYNKAFSFPGTIQLFSAARVSIEGMEPLLAREEVAVWTGALPAPVEESVAAEAPKPRRPVFPIARFWKEQIGAEENIRPGITLIDEADSDQFHGVMFAPHDSDAALEGVEDGDLIFFNGSKIGSVVAEHTRSGNLAFRAFGGFHALNTGDVLTIQPVQSAESLLRRALAVRRILQGRAPITDLVKYFDPSSSAVPEKVAEEVKDSDLSGYGLNEDQLKAFRLLWSMGPIGLLQGPPGTGKTTFISAFVHYALTKGGLRNVLLVSQSHEAVNTAAERIQTLMRDASGNLDMLRIANNPDKISDALRRSHVDTVHDLYVARFESEAKERLSMIGRRLGIPSAFTSDYFEVLEGPVEIARQLAILHTLEVDAADAASVDRRIAALHEALAAQFQRFNVEMDVKSEPYDIEGRLVDLVRAYHNFHDQGAIRRLRAVWQIGREWVRTLRTKSRTLEEFLAGSRSLVCGTCVGIGNPRLRITEKTFDLVVIDEAARATSSELAVAMQSAHRVLLVGDHRQLPPTIDRDTLKQLALRMGIVNEKELLQSDFERVFGSGYGRQVGVALQRQYRMAPAIGAMVSDVFYQDVGLITERPPPGPHYSDLPFPFDYELTWVDCSQGFGELRKGTSFNNPAEAKAIISMLEKLAGEHVFLEAVKAELKEGEPLVGVICMYAQQRDLLQDLISTSSIPKELRAFIKIETVDSYQGKENKIVIVSLVRNNTRGQIGFLDTENRINVALSRAMDRLIIVGAADMFRNSDSKLSQILSHIEIAGRYSKKVDELEAA